MAEYDGTFHRVRTRSFAGTLTCILITLAAPPASADGPAPMLATGHPVQWWFVFKLNAAKFPQCGAQAPRSCPFGGEVQPYTGFSQQYAYASNENPQLQQGAGCVGATATDPLGATFEEIYNGSYHYVIWNDQFYQDPEIAGCSGDSCSAPWGHSKGMLVWDDNGDGLVLQVTTPSWPAAGSSAHPRQSDGNTLGCISNNNVKFSQHFFALSLSHQDVITVLSALANASVVTDPNNPQVVSNGGPNDIHALVALLGKKSTAIAPTIATLSTNARVISKPSALHVPPWQLVSALLGGVSLRTATWWGAPQIPTTTTGSTIECWDPSLPASGGVQIATGGTWDHTPIGLTAGPSPDANHAKIGVSTDAGLAIFGDMNQQGAISGNEKACGRSQNGRGGLFFVIQDPQLSSSIGSLISGKTAPAE